MTEKALDFLDNEIETRCDIARKLNELEPCEIAGVRFGEYDSITKATVTVSKGIEKLAEMCNAKLQTNSTRNENELVKTVKTFRHNGVTICQESYGAPESEEVSSGERIGSKTYIEDFFEKFPDAMKTDQLVPDACRESIYPENCGCSETYRDCEECWTDEMKEPKLNDHRNNL